MPAHHYTTPIVIYLGGAHPSGPAPDQLSGRQVLTVQPSAPPAETRPLLTPAIATCHAAGSPR